MKGQQPPAYLIPEFLASDEARPLRILAEYLEPLRRFREQKIEDTIVFFGSARVESRARALQALRREKRGSPKVRVGTEIGLTCLQATKKSLVCDG